MWGRSLTLRNLPLLKIQKTRLPLSTLSIAWIFEREQYKSKESRHPSVHYNSNYNSNVNSSIESQSPILDNSIVTQPQIVNSSVNNQALDETEIVHLGKSSKDDCSLFIQTGKKTHKALWDSGACKCVLSLESYKMIPGKYKTDLFSSNIKIKAANGTIINNNGECDITFRMGTEKFTFPFLCSDQLSQAIIIGHNFCNTLNIGTVSHI